MITKNVLKEAWKGIDFTEYRNDQLVRPTKADGRREVSLCCNVPGLNARSLQVVNGQTDSDDGRLHIRVGAGECPDRPIQIQSVVCMDQKALIELDTVIEVEAGAKVQIIHCDDTVGSLRSLSDNRTEIHVGENAEVEYYKMQNLNDQSGLVNQTFVTMQAGARVKMNCISLNGGHICNHIEVRMKGEDCQLDVDGLYLMDREQRCDNYVFVEHACGRCRSSELYKGIIDDSARATFNGHVLVMDGAVKTEAYQSNKNILLTDKARVETKPFLEIYNDDVKCSHGSTIGRLDDQALFYLQTRGISERTAKTMLSYAFCDEVIRRIGIPELREAMEDMVKKRLHGELTPCSECSIKCSTPCNGPDADFKIDVDKL